MEVSNNHATAPLRHEEIMQMESGRAEFTIACIRVGMVFLFFLIDFFLYKAGKEAVGFNVPLPSVIIDGCYFACSAALLVLLRWKGATVPPWAIYCIILLDYGYFSLYIFSYRDSGFPGLFMEGMVGSIAMLLVCLCGLRFNYHATIFASIAGVFSTILFGYILKAGEAISLSMASMVGIIGLIATYISYRHRAIVQHIVERSKFERFLPRQVVDQLITGSQELELGGKEREVTVLFTDIRGFTTLCETMKPLEIMELLNDYFSAVAAVIFKYFGTLDKFIGDAVMAVFGAPVNNKDDATRAVKCALEIREVVKNINVERKTKNLSQISFGIGIHTGIVVAGNLGSPERMEYTVIGDTVNVASRVEGLTRKLGAEILITEATKNSIGDIVPCVAKGTVSVKGRAEPLAVYSL